MSALLISQRVVDVSIWEQIMTADRDTRRSYGAQGDRQFRNTANLEEVLILIDWDNADRARLYAQSDDLRLTLARAGAIGPPLFWVLDGGEKAFTSG